MENSFNPEQIERELYAQWETSDFFTPTGNGDPYCILIPPPNVTGTLHMGHAFNQTLMDALIRYQRMNGRHTLGKWVPIMQVSPPRCWSSDSSRQKVKPATIWVERLYRTCLGLET